jgi:hypothetical protein
MHILSSNRRLLPVLLATGFLADQLATSHYFDISSESIFVRPNE